MTFWFNLDRWAPKKKIFFHLKIKLIHIEPACKKKMLVEVHEINSDRPKGVLILLIRTKQDTLSRMKWWMTDEWVGASSSIKWFTIALFTCWSFSGLIFWINFTTNFDMFRVSLGFTLWSQKVRHTAMTKNMHCSPVFPQDIPHQHCRCRQIRAQQNQYNSRYPALRWAFCAN